MIGGSVRKVKRRKKKESNLDINREKKKKLFDTRFSLDCFLVAEKEKILPLLLHQKS